MALSHTDKFSGAQIKHVFPDMKGRLSLENSKIFEEIVPDISDNLITQEERMERFALMEAIMKANYRSIYPRDLKQYCLRCQGYCRVFDWGETDVNMPDEVIVNITDESPPNVPLQENQQIQ